MGYFAISASFSPSGIQSLRRMTAVKLKSNLEEAAAKLGGCLTELYFNAGNLGMFAIFDLPSVGSSGPLIQLMASGAFDPSAALLRLETSSELDAALGSG